MYQGCIQIHLSTFLLNLLRFLELFSTPTISTLGKAVIFLYPSFVPLVLIYFFSFSFLLSPFFFFFMLFLLLSFSLSFSLFLQFSLSLCLSVSGVEIKCVVCKISGVNRDLQLWVE